MVVVLLHLSEQSEACDCRGFRSFHDLGVPTQPISPSDLAEVDQLSAMQREQSPASRAIMDSVMSEDTSGLEGLGFEDLRVWVQGLAALDEIEGPGDIA